MAQVDLEAAAREAEAWFRTLEALRGDLDAMQREVAGAVEAHAARVVASMVPAAREAEARAVVARCGRIAGEVGAWVVGRSPLALADRLLPELRAGAEELRALLAPLPPPAPGAAGGALRGA